jgi:cell division protein FtsZ
VCDSIVVIPNDKLLAIVDKNMGIKDSFRIVDNVLSRAVTGISGVILKHGDNDINLDFADLKTVMSHKGTALMGVGEASGNDAAYQAMKNAIESPLFDNISISGAMGVLVHVNMHPNYPLVQIQQAMSIVYESADQDADVIFGTTTDENLDIDRVVITIVATGFEKEAANSYAIKQADKEAVAQEKVQVRNIRKISGGYDITFDEDELQVPTYLRRQMD